LYLPLLFFGASLFAAQLLAPRAPPWGWLLPREAERHVGLQLYGHIDGRRIWRRTRTAGWLAAVAAVGVALAETSDAAGGRRTRSTRTCSRLRLVPRAGLPFSGSRAPRPSPAARDA